MNTVTDTLNIFKTVATVAASVPVTKEEEHVRDELDRKIATATETSGLATITANLIDLMVDYTEDPTERTGLLQTAKLISEDTSLLDLQQRIKEVAGNFGALSEDEQQQLRIAGKYTIICDIDANQNIDLDQLTQTMRYLSCLQTFNMQVAEDKFPTSTISAIPPLPKTIRTINLNGCSRLTDNGLRPLADCPNVTTLILADSAIISLPPLSKGAQESLQEIDLSRCKKLAPQSFNALSQYTALKSAGLAFTQIESLSHLSKSLEAINIYQCDNLSEEELASLTLFPALKKIKLNQHSIVAALPQSIEEIDLSHVPNLPTYALEALSRLPVLKKINLASTDITFLPILSETLEEIDISDNPIPASKIAAFQQLHPKVKIIRA